ncbi:hypothetical protein [Trinickia mobilis]|uniref:hypothetical protein n=1 Tax=Trinickia mobilis TaxID=2816356 RepID=UPI001A8E8F66|nr:hypothetical protein [Trinickia mobilis]
MEQYTDAEWDWLIAEATSVARRDADEKMPWHRAFAIGLLQAVERLRGKERPNE